MHCVLDCAETCTKSVAISFSHGWLDLYWHQGGNGVHPLASIHFQAVETSIGTLVPEQGGSTTRQE